MKLRNVIAYRVVTTALVPVALLGVLGCGAVTPEPVTEAPAVLIPREVPRWNGIYAADNPDCIDAFRLDRRHAVNTRSLLVVGSNAAYRMPFTQRSVTRINHTYDDTIRGNEIWIIGACLKGTRS